MRAGDRLLGITRPGSRSRATVKSTPSTGQVMDTVWVHFRPTFDFPCSRMFGWMDCLGDEVN